MANQNLPKVIPFPQSNKEAGNAIEKPRWLLSYLTVPEVAKELGVSESYVCDLINNKIEGVPGLPAIKVAGDWLVSPFSLWFWAKTPEGWSDEKARREAESKTRNCQFTAEQILAGNVPPGWPTPEQVILGAIPNFKN